ncbi:MAG: Homing endonuclease associated repeat [Solirubrobacteraceae bacterium]|nr:Homing endonuclease associated repeat [Solirubrobacteraceae bacterium]
MARKLGLQAGACRCTIERFATDVDHAARRVNMAGTRTARTYSHRDIMLALTSASARLGCAPSAKEYAAVAREMELPSLKTVVNRIGSWSEAVMAAGLDRAAEPPRPRACRWTEQACWEALRHAVEELGEIPLVLAYERFTVARSDLPSSATIRNRLGRWSSLAARLAAQRELAQQVQVRARTAGDALARSRWPGTRPRVAPAASSSATRRSEAGALAPASGDQLRLPGLRVLVLVHVLQAGLVHVRVGVRLPVMLMVMLVLDMLVVVARVGVRVSHVVVAVLVGVRCVVLVLFGHRCSLGG